MDGEKKPRKGKGPPKGKLVDLAIADLMFSRELQAREKGLDDDHVEDLVAAIKAGKKLPRVRVMNIGDVHYVTDGHHTVEAHARAGLKSVPCNVHKGEWGDAVLVACGANRQHDHVGLKRKNADKVRAVLIMLRTFPKWSDRMIAEHIGVDNTTVGRHRPQEEPGARDTELDNPPEPDPEPTRMGKDGQERRVPKRQLPKEQPNGRPVVDWAGLDQHLGHVLRLPETIMRAHPDALQNPLIHGMTRLLEELAKAVKEARKTYAGG